MNKFSGKIRCHRSCVGCILTMRPADLMRSPAFWAAVSAIRGMMQGDPLLPMRDRPHEHPVFHLNNLVQQPIVTDATGWFSHFLFAKEQIRSSPAEQQGGTGPDGLLQTVARLAARQGDTGAAVDERLSKLRQLEAVSKTLEALNEALVAGMPAHVRAVAGGMKIATMAAIQHALEYPDTTLATCFHEGFDIVGDIEPSGIHPHKTYVREENICELPHHVWLDTV